MRKNKLETRENLVANNIAGPNNASIPHTRIPTELKEMMDKAIAELNREGYLEVTVPAFIRQAIRFYANECLTKQLGLSFKDLNGDKKK